MTTKRIIGKRTIGLVAVIGLAFGVAACGHINNPLSKSQPGKYKGSGTRIPVIAFDQSLKVADALKGTEFYLPDPQVVADWPTPGGTPSQSIEHADAAHDFVVDWKANFGRPSGRAFHVTAPPVAADGRIYVMDGAADVSARDLKTGREIWRKDLSVRTRRSGEAFGGGLAFADGKLFVASGYRFVAAVDAATGKLLWRTMTEAPVHAAPTVSGGRVFVESTDDNLLTFDAATGAAGWAYQALPEPARILSATSPAVSGDAVVAAFASGELVSLQASNGTGLWTAALSKSNRNSALSEIRDIPGRPVIYRGDVFAVSHSGLFASIELRTGAEHWQLPLTSVTSPWPVGDVVYITDTAGEVLCVARDSGLVYWIVDMNKGAKKAKDRAIWSGPVLVSNRLVVVSSKGEAVALNPKTGETLKRLRLGSEALMNPIAVGPDLYVAAENAELIAIR
jgi:outer membrane protein assembly factor BamB